MTGKCSVFGGANDAGMTKGEGLALWEHSEADKRKDLFNPRPLDLSIGTSKRLRDDAFYFAHRYELEPAINRRHLQNTPWLFRNPSNGKVAIASLADWGPNERTGRDFDLSPALAAFLGVQTDDQVQGIELDQHFFEDLA